MYLNDLSIRKRRNPYTKHEEEYAVFKVCHEDMFDTFHLARGTNKYFKIYTLMCFREEIYTRVVVGDRFSFKGTIHMSYGNTYIKVKKAYDELDFDIETKDSLYNQKEIRDEKDAEKLEEYGLAIDDHLQAEELLMEQTMKELYECPGCHRRYEVSGISFTHVNVKDVETGVSAEMPEESIICFQCEDESHGTCSQDLQRLVKL